MALHGHGAAVSESDTRFGLWTCPQVHRHECAAFPNWWKSANSEGSAPPLAVSYAPHAHPHLVEYVGSASAETEPASASARGVWSLHFAARSETCRVSNAG